MKENDELITQSEAMKIAGISRSGIWRGVKTGTFPQPVRLGARCTRWSLAEVVEWVEHQKSNRVAQACYSGERDGR